MHPEERFHLIQKRAYEICRQRDSPSRDNRRRLAISADRDREGRSIRVAAAGASQRANALEGLTAQSVPGVENPA
jgi:hypothetical protein